MATSVELPTSPLELLTERVTYEGWEYWAQRRQRFYVTRAFGVLEMSPVQNSMLELYRYWMDAQKEIQNSAGWQAINFSWHSNIAYSQFLRVARGRPLLFDKAAKVVATAIYACSRWSRDVSQAERAKAVRIVPAVFFIEGFDEKVLREVRARDGGLSRVMNGTGQSERLLVDMTRGFCVTRRTADSVLLEVNALLPGQQHLMVEYRPGGSRLGSLGASEEERLHSHRPL